MSTAKVWWRSAGAAIAVGLPFPAPSAAQAPLGPFTWQLQPYCNVVVVSATPDGPGFRLEGFDDQCGASRRAPLMGTATQNPDGTIAFAFVVITSDGRGNPTAAHLNPSNFGGTWVDSAGLIGTLVFGGSAPGPPRPAPQLPHAALAPNAVTSASIADGTVGGADVNPTEVQLRVQGRCPPGQFLVSIDAAGATACTHGAGLANVALGSGTLRSNTTGDGNIAVGNDALSSNSTGVGNTAVGHRALFSTTTSRSNTAVGFSALSQATGRNNIALGTFAGAGVNGGNFNIHIGDTGLGDDSATIRLGSHTLCGTPCQTRTFIAGIRSRITGSADAVSVLIDGNGQLGTISSSRRVKEDIADMGEASSELRLLRPVTFRYTQPYADGSTPLDYGLIAEEVADVYPDLVARDASGEIETVQYHKLTPMLLNELQRLQRELALQRESIQALEDRLQQLESGRR